MKVIKVISTLITRVIYALPAAYDNPNYEVIISVLIGTWVYIRQFNKHTCYIIYFTFFNKFVPDGIKK